MVSARKELEQQLIDAGNKLLEPPDSVDELLPLLDLVENYLSRVEQSPPKSMQNAISSSQKALVADKLFRHSDVSVKVAVASCISEITRITAPEAPYDDEQMKEVFQLIVSSFENLSDKSSRSYAKRTLILETVAKVRSCVIMLDLECDAQIIEMFQHFLEAIRDDHPANVFLSMETIMKLVLEESEDVPPELLFPFLECLKKDNKEVLPIAQRLAEKVLKCCAAKVKPYLLEAVKCSGFSLDDYSELVASVCLEASVAVEQNDVHAEHMTDEDKIMSMKAPIDEAAQVDKEIVTEEASTEQVDPADNRSPKSIVNNGMAQTGEDKSLHSNPLKKDDPANLLDQSKDVETASNVKPDGAVDDKALSEEDKPEQTTPRKGKKPSYLVRSEEPSESSQIDDKKETETVDRKSDNNKEVPSSPREPTSDGAVSSENEKETTNQVSSEATESESMDVASPPPSGDVPNESRTRRYGRTKKKDVFLKEATVLADGVPVKASERISDSDAKPLKRSGKKVPAGSANEDKTLADISKNESGASSDLEAKLLKQSAKKVDVSSNNGDRSLKESHYKKRPQRATAGKDSSRSSTKDDKEKVSSPKPSTKLTKDDQLFDATSKSNSKRKLTVSNEKGSGTEDLGEELVGSEVKVWWPLDRKYYEGVIEAFDPVKKKHKVSYKDGDVEILNLKREKWEFVRGDTDLKEEAADDECLDTSSEMPLKKKAKTSAERTAKRGKVENSAKRGGGASSSKSKSGNGKSSSKSKDEMKADGKSKDGSKTKSEDDSVGENRDHTSKSSSKSADVATKSAKDDAVDTSKSGKSKESKSSSKSADVATKSVKNDAVDTSKSGKSKEGGSGTPKTPKVSASTKGKSSKSVGKSNANGSGKSKSSSTKVKEDENVKDSTVSAEVSENTKGESSSLSKTPASDAKSGKKRWRVSKS